MCEKNSARIATLEEEIQELRKTVESLAFRRDEKKAAEVPLANNDDVVAGDVAPMEKTRMEVAEQNQAEELSNEPLSSNAQNFFPHRYHNTMHNNHRHSPYEIGHCCHFCDHVGYSDSCRSVLNLFISKSAQRGEIARAKQL
ncbi:hypothetical protein Y032_0021g360 [Ancylostoma ceylanicum]|uniref:Uncharacterized protein n=1 Tax=Ancylostoma ceylanicum TaxID=53326 RepID=A0A016UZ37_9BILA|nr:hypothetical protein Y032_0021g360 [Ancylostoma ceylanicum]